MHCEASMSDCICYVTEPSCNTSISQHGFNVSVQMTSLAIEEVIEEQTQVFADGIPLS